MSAEVRVENLGKRYGGFWALRDINLAIKEEFFAIMGPNGSGKSTLAKIIATVERPTTGVVYVSGYNALTHTKEVRERISYLPEEDTLSDLLTGMENILFFSRLMGLGASEAKSRAKELLEEFGLAEDANKKVGKYSKGMKRKLAVLIALIVDKPVIILDEPTSGLDPIMRRL